MALLKAFIFDIDGTLVDSNQLHVEAWDRAFRHFGKHFSHGELEAQIGKGSDQYIPEFLNPDEIEAFGKELDQYRSELFEREYLPRVRPFPKVRELFTRIREDEKKIALATSGKKAEAKYYMEILRIENLVDAETNADDTERSKPAPDIFHAALDKLNGISAKNAVVMGDTRFDMEAAHKADLRAVGLVCGGTSKAELTEAGAIAVFYDPADVLMRYNELFKLER